MLPSTAGLIPICQLRSRHGPDDRKPLNNSAVNVTAAFNDDRWSHGAVEATLTKGKGWSEKWKIIVCFIEHRQAKQHHCHADIKVNETLWDYSQSRGVTNKPHLGD